jgi:hypothetical protein
MPKCNVCGCRWYRRTEYEPGESCPCGYCANGDTLWNIDKWRAIRTWLKWKYIRIRYWWWWDE